MNNLDKYLPVEAVPGAFLEGNVKSRSGHPDGVSVKPDLEIGLLVDYRVLRGFDRTAKQHQTKDVDRYE